MTPAKPTRFARPFEQSALVYQVYVATGSDKGQHPQLSEEVQENATAFSVPPCYLICAGQGADLLQSGRNIYLDMDHFAIQTNNSTT